jgi:hypothetical protein
MDDWANKRGIATEPNIDRFVTSVGGERVVKRLPNAMVPNADYIFEQERVIVELKILETEFGETVPFKKKQSAICRQVASKFSFGEIVRWENGPAEFYALRMLELFRAPLSRVAKKANKQVKQTKIALNDNSYRGVLWLVNDNFREVGFDLIFCTMCRILNGANSQIRALIYVTNHFVRVPDNDYANLLWVPVYANHEQDKGLPEFVNWLGTEWHNFIEAEMGSFDQRLTGPDIPISGAYPIR